MTSVPDAGPDAPKIPWTAILVGVWGLGVGISLMRTLRRWQHTSAVVSRSLPGDAGLHAVVRDLASLLALRRAADVRLSAEIDSPMITGVRRPVILVPADRFPSLSPDQQRMALCHELAHMQRGDLWLGCVPAAVERCFFFHPLARLAAREYAFWREAACDEAVLTTLGASPHSYGRLLLALGVSRQPATLSVAGAAWSFPNLKRRITMLSRPSSPSLGRRVLAAGAVALTIVAMAPVRAVARSAEPAEPALTRSLAGAAAPPEIQSPAIGTVNSATATALARPSVSSPARTAPRIARAQERRQEKEVQFVYFRDESTTTMSGSTGDISRARRYRRSGDPMLWFRRDGREYVVRDANVLREVDDLWAPVSRIGEEQGRLGAQQGELGAQQGRHGARQGEIGAKQGVIGARQGVVSAQLGVLAAREGEGVTASERREIDRERQALNREMRRLDREMAALHEDMREFHPPMRELGEEMAALGRQMEVLGGRMEDASRRAHAGMRTLIDRAITSGAAEAVP
jgi:beta-lactamase regulating signal transducer with metallopeptidase domain